MKVLDGILYGEKESVMMAVGLQLGELGFQNYEALGFVVDDTLVGGVLYSNQRGATIEMTVAANDPRWCTRAALRRIFEYPFEQLQRKSVFAVCKRSGVHSRDFVKRIGFKLVGPVPDLYWSEDGVLYAMKRENCKWLGDS